MDPISVIVLSLALGIAAGFKTTAEQAIVDAYDGIKTVIKSRYPSVSIDVLKVDPSSQARQEVIKEELKSANADSDLELLEKAKRLLEVIENIAPEAIGIVGIKLEDVRAASVTIEDVISSGTGVHIHKADIQGEIDIKKVRAGNTHPKA